MFKPFWSTNSDARRSYCQASCDCLWTRKTSLKIRGWLVTKHYLNKYPTFELCQYNPINQNESLFMPGMPGT